MEMRLSVNEICLSRRGDLLSHIRACARHGITGMEIRKPFLQAYLRQGGTLDALRGCLEECGVRPVCLNSIESISFNDKRGMRLMSELSEYLFYCCRAIGCDCVEVIGSFKVPAQSWEEIRENTAQALLSLSDTARPYGVKLALEYMALPPSSVQTFSQALDIVNAVGRENVGILLDTWHHQVAGSAVEEIRKADRGQIFMVHTSDCPPCQPMGLPRPQSYMPGTGGCDIAGMLAGLKAVGYDGAVSVEVMAPELQEMEEDPLLELAKQTTLPLLAAL